ncbi:hypothetical protein T09_2219, partial [Trichinella sp. T9]
LPGLCQSARAALAGPCHKPEPKFYSPPSAHRPHTTAQGRETTTLMGSREPENLGDVLPDEGDLRPRVEEAIHHHLVSVRSIGA